MLWQVLVYLSAFAVDVDFIPFDCIQHVDALQKLTVVTVTPLAAVCLLGFLSWVMSKNRRTKKFSQLPRTAGFVLIYIIFPYASAVVFRMLRPCHVLDKINQDGTFLMNGGKYMHEDYGIDCDSPKYSTVYWLAFIMLWVYPFGVPVFFLFLLRRNKVSDPLWQGWFVLVFCAIVLLGMRA